MQKLTIIGNLGRDPEERFTNTGKKVIGFPVAVRVTKEKTQWYEIAIWEERIQVFSKILPYFKKGSRICILGDLNVADPYKGKDGNVKIKLRIIPDSLNFVGSSQDKTLQEQKSQEKACDPYSETEFPSNEIPF